MVAVTKWYAARSFVVTPIDMPGARWHMVAAVAVQGNP